MPDIVTSRIFATGEKNITAAKLNDIVASSAIQTSFVGSKPVASSAAPADNLLLLTQGGTYAQVPFQTVIDSVNSGLNLPNVFGPMRLRSFNALGNNTFEVDQRNVGNTVATPANATFAIDRWQIGKVGTMVISVGQNATTVLVPGISPNFALTSKALRLTLTTLESTLAAGDNFTVSQYVEGPRFRELSGDVHSISVLVRSSVAGLSFGVSVRDPATTTKSLVKLCTIPAANVWTLITLSNLPQMTGGNFSANPGVNGYIFGICLAAGTTFITPSNDTFQNGNFVGAVAQSNFAASPLSSTFDLAFCQHEPGSVCTTPMDKSFSQNLDEALRYYEKSYLYGIAAGTVTNNGMAYGPALVNTSPSMPIMFKKVMAKTPTLVGYSNITGAINNVRDVTVGGDRTTTGPLAGGDGGFGGFAVTTPNPSNNALYQFHWIADTGW